ncbi:hypothetical protein [Nannocystis pusilla]|uniref:hypothetical protein n=1 Tax=Nannocystis pusilla TaxID=889268 RepID=UPI003B81B8F8
MTSNEHEPMGGKNPTLGQAARAFFTFHSPRIFAVMWPLLVATRLAVGDFGWADLLVVPILLAAQPFVEWLIHVYILHFKPTTVWGRKFDLQIAKFHRAHHRDPWRLELVFIPGAPAGSAWRCSPPCGSCSRPRRRWPSAASSAA